MSLSIYGGTYYITPIIITCVIATKLLNRYYMKTYTEIVRLESITKSPIVSLYSETLNGITTIRAFSQEKHFLSRHFSNLNENIKN